AHREDSAEDLAHAVCANTDFWGKDLSASLPGFEAEVAGFLKDIEEKGTYAVMKDCL
ncbi:MAG TPA: tagaturonate reductase, partial [Lachnospiraceae bacterium]|nr:tagaturonate reductase [Lachnospiraceae bacterium]